MSGYISKTKLNLLFPPLNKNVNLWGKEGLPDTFCKRDKTVINYLNKRAYPETKQTLLFLKPSRS